MTATRSGPVTSPVRMLRSWLGPTSSSMRWPGRAFGIWSSRRASSLTTFTRPRVSMPSTPSRIPWSMASRSCTSATISAGSSPKVTRLMVRARTSDATTPRARATAPLSRNVVTSWADLVLTVDSRMPTETSPTGCPPAPMIGLRTFADRPRSPLSIPVWIWPSRATTGSSIFWPTRPARGCE